METEQMSIFEQLDKLRITSRSEITLHGEIVCSVQRHAINNHF